MLIITIALLSAQQQGGGGGHTSEAGSLRWVCGSHRAPQLEEKSSSPSSAQQINGGDLNLLCPVEPEIEAQRKRWVWTDVQG